MLTRNSQIEKLLEEGDFNVRVTIYDPRIFPTLNDQLGAWKEAIRDSLGGGIVHDSKLYNLSLRTPEGVLLNNVNVCGCEVAQTILRFCKVPKPIRITLKTSSNQRVWIIA